MKLVFNASSCKASTSHPEHPSIPSDNPFTLPQQLYLNSIASTCLQKFLIHHADTLPSLKDWVIHGVPKNGL